MNTIRPSVPALDARLAPPAVLGAGALGRLVFDGADPAALAQALQRTRAAAAPATLYDLGLLRLYGGERGAALALQAQALRRQTVYRVVGAVPPLRPPRLRLLALMMPGDLMANTPLEFILTGSEVQLDLFYLLPGQPLPAALPEHDLAFAAVAQSEAGDAALRRLRPLLAAWPRPVVNDPAQILRLAREQASAILTDAPGVEVAPTRRATRAAVQAWARGEEPLPLELAGGGIIRPVGSHAGKGLAKIDHAGALADYLGGQAAAEFYVARYVDYRSPDGQFRKYRIVFIDQQPFLCHLAIGRDWMLHYVGADMAAVAANRAEEARAMAGFDHGFARRHASALAALAQRFRLDYFGVDCGETRGGRLLVFELASAMVIHTMDSPQLYPYKQAQMQKTFAAFHQMLRRVAAGPRPEAAWPPR